MALIVPRSSDHATFFDPLAQIEMFEDWLGGVEDVAGILLEPHYLVIVVSLRTTHLH